jgi:hypothetical protein
VALESLLPDQKSDSFGKRQLLEGRSIEILPRAGADPGLQLGVSIVLFRSGAVRLVGAVFMFPGQSRLHNVEYPFHPHETARVEAHAKAILADFPKLLPGFLAAWSANLEQGTP